MRADWLTRVYLAFLALLPAAYREEYGDELAYAIRSAVADARAKGRLALARLAWRELRDLPPSILRAHLAQWEEHAMRLQAGLYLPDGPIRSYQLAALFVPFMIPLLMALPALMGVVSLPIYTGVGWVMIGLVIVTAAAGLVRRFPVWSLPTLGFLLFVVWTPLKLLAQAAILTLLGRGGKYWPDALPDRLALSAGLDVAFLAIGVLIALLLLLISRPLWDRARRDWTLLSLLLYGLAIPYVFLNDPYRGLGPYEVVSTLLLAAGAAVFVFLGPRRWQRLLALVVALLLAHPVLSLGVYQIFPAQTFAGPDPSFRLWETLQPVIELPVLLSLICLPALLSLLPAPGSHASALKQLQPS
jgi:hypothetical protein